VPTAPAPLGRDGCYQVNPELPTSAILCLDTFTSLQGTQTNPLSTEKKTLVVRQRQDAFTLRYDALYRWACRLTQDPIEAEDLLQDCYVAFVTTSTNARIENLDGYLRRMLAYMLRSKRMSEARYPVAEVDEANHISTVPTLVE